MTDHKHALQHYRGVLAQARSAFPATAANHVQCLACLEYSEQGEVETEFQGGEPFDICPLCGSTELEDAYLCETCGIRPIGEGLDDCDVCFAAREAEQDATLARAKELEKELNQHFQEEHA